MRTALVPDFGAIDLARMRHLQSLSVQGLSVNLQARWPDGFKLATGMLNTWSARSTPPPAHLRHLRLDFLFRGGLEDVMRYWAQSMDRDWAVMEGALLGWGWLSDIVFEARCLVSVGGGCVVPVHVSKEHLVRTLKAKMPVLCERGSLVFD